MYTWRSIYIPRFIEKECYKEIVKKNLQQSHLGLIMVEENGIHRENLGAKVLVYCFYIANSQI